MVPVKGYATGAPLVFGIGEEIIWPFLASLLGLQATYEINSYNDLVTYNNEIYDSFSESLSGLAGQDIINKWVLNAVQGLIETDSIIWQKFREWVISNYTVSSGLISVPSNNIYNVPAFVFDNANNFESTYKSANYAWTQECIGTVYNSLYYSSSDEGRAKTQLFASADSNASVTSYLLPNHNYPSTTNLTNTYTMDSKTVYYAVKNFSSPVTIISPDVNSYSNIPIDNGIACWVMVYGGFSGVSDNVGYYSDAFDNVITSSEKEDIIDGTSVIQLYNPADYQNGLQFVPDPEEPNDIKIPFAITADWWNFLQQNGNGENSNQYVNAYNALNGLGNNITTGKISDAYDSLGIASLISSAQDALNSIASLTDTNIYPQGQTIAQTIDNNIPSGLTPETPDSGIDNESEQGLYKLPDLREYFPFCIPFDLIDLLSCFVAEPETPSFVIGLSTGDETVTSQIDLHIWDNIASVIRTFELIGFTVGLILITRNIIRG